EGGIPLPCCRDFKYWVLNSLCEGKNTLGCSARLIDPSIHHAFLDLKWSVTPKGCVAIDHRAVCERAYARPKRHFGRESVCNSEPRLENIPMSRRQPFRKSVIQPGELPRVQGRHSTTLGIRHTV